MAALLISGLSYWDQHKSNKTAATTIQESAARLINPIWNYSTSTLTLQNLGETEISAVQEVFEVDVIGDSSPSANYPAILDFDVGSLSPCSSITTDISSKDVQSRLQFYSRPNSFKNSDYLIAPEFVLFADNQENLWEENISNGDLVKLNSTYDFGVNNVIGILVKANVVSNNCV
jgi:hypothetical protein